MNLNKKLQPLTGGNTGKMEEFLFGSTFSSGQTTEIDASTSKEKKVFSSMGMSFKNEMGSMSMSFKKKIATGLGTTDEITEDDATVKSRNPMSLMTAAISGNKKKTSQSDAEILSTKISQVMMTMEDFRLQCPQTHAGLVLAFSGNSLSPITGADLKFKWHRIDPGNGQFIQIDESTRAWYPPTADDIGRKICLQCEDSLEQGFCRYVEAGPVEADPLLVTMMDLAMAQSKFEVRDVILSMTTYSAGQLGTKEGCAVVDPPISGTGATDLPTPGTPDAASKSVSSPSPAAAKAAVTKPSGASIQMPGKVRVDVSVLGILIGDSFGMGGEPGTTGLRIHSAPILQSHCQLPSSVLVVLPLAGNRTREDNSNGGIGGAANGNAEISDLWQWVGDCKGEVFEKLSSFLSGLPPDAEELRITIGCNDRMHRDALALSIRTLAALPLDTEPRRRLLELPWLGGDGTVARGVSTGGQDVCSRLKAVEEENAALRKKRAELTLQLLESGVGAGAKEGVDGSDTAEAEVAGGAQRDLQAANELHKARELDLERSNLELAARLKRLTHDSESTSSQVSELKQKLAEALQDCNVATQKLEAEKRISESVRQELAREAAKRESTDKETTMQQDRAVRDLKSALSAAESELRVVSEQRAALESELRNGADDAAKTAAMLAQTSERCSRLEDQLLEEVSRREQLLADVARIEDERKRAEAEMISPSDFAEVEAKAAELLGERNHWQRKAESLSKDLRRVMHEAAERERDLEGQLERRHTDIEALKMQLAAYRAREVEAEPVKEVAQPVRRRSISFNLGLRKGAKASKDASTAASKTTEGGTPK